MQETFIGFSNSLVNYDDKRDLQTWLFTIAAQGHGPVAEDGPAPLPERHRHRRRGDGPGARRPAARARPPSPAAPNSASARRTHSDRRSATSCATSN
ncbi:sigma-70 family RNA polymerase sigma factor [Gemmata sp. G18]|uniref:Sigma-70 family RNA polymerase sigma factor n=1 Tax=Gemmata palustris TaxID=2822762 RepID=A0ABS5BWL2_9BACT|nr:sigma-70 family RNA polymerase sigma factor [Gemmata palustris]